MRKIVISVIVCLLLTVAVHAQTDVTNKTALKTALQLKLDEWHKAGSFPGAQAVETFAARVLTLPIVAASPPDVRRGYAAPGPNIL